MLDIIECRHRKKKRKLHYVLPPNQWQAWQWLERMDQRYHHRHPRESGDEEAGGEERDYTGRPSLCLWGKQRKKMRKTRVKIWEMTLLRRKSHPYHLSFLCCWHILFSEGDTVVGISVSSSGLSWSIRSNEMRLRFFVQDDKNEILSWFSTVSSYKIAFLWHVICSRHYSCWTENENHSCSHEHILLLKMESTLQEEV